MALPKMSDIRDLDDTQLREAILAVKKDCFSCGFGKQRGSR